ncbi:MAG: GNAT family N-acetyltransferase [Planctomycetota bacterium]
MSVDAIYQSPLGPIEIGPMEPDRDRSSILELFAATFDREKSAAEWDWQFVKNPVGSFYEVGRNEAGRVVSQFAVVPTRVQIADRDFVFGQVVDSMVHPDYRVGLKHRGLFATTTDGLVDRCGHRDGLLIMVGLPNPPAFRIGRRMNQYHPMGKVYFHSKTIIAKPQVPTIPESLKVRGESFRIEAVSRFSPDLDGLWQRLRKGHRTIAHRDAQLMNWRYAEAVGSDYHILEVRDAHDGLLLGFAVGVIGYLNRPDGIIADWFVDPARPFAAEALLKVIEETMANTSMTRVQCFLNFAAEESRFFEDRGYELAPTHYRMVSRSYDSDIVTPNALGREWYYTLGDFDVV